MGFLTLFQKGQKPELWKLQIFSILSFNCSRPSVMGCHSQTTGPAIWLLFYLDSQSTINNGPAPLQRAQHIINILLRFRYPYNLYLKFSIKLLCTDGNRQDRTSVTTRKAPAKAAKISAGLRLGAAT